MTPCRQRGDVAGVADSGEPLLTRRRWIAGVAGVAGAVLAGTAVDAFAIEPGRVSVTRHLVGPPEGRTIRIVQLSDLHLREIGRHEERVADTVAGLRPDVLLLTGDAIDRAGDVPLLASFLALLPPAHAKLAILGNWEHWAGLDVPLLAAAYERAGWQLLVNESVTLSFGASRLLVTGLDDLVGGHPDVRHALREAAPVFDHVVLAHCPLHRDVYSAAALMRGAGGLQPGSVDPRLLKPRLMLSGHTHGGQIAPFGWAPLRPRGSGSYVQGWYHGEFPLYVSRGIGTSVIPARLGATPEVALFEWRLVHDRS